MRNTFHIDFRFEQGEAGANARQTDLEPGPL